MKIYHNHNIFWWKYTTIIITVFRSHEHIQLRQPPCLKVKDFQVFVTCFIVYPPNKPHIQSNLFSKCILSSGGELLTSYRGSVASREVGMLESTNLQKNFSNWLRQWRGLQQPGHGPWDPASGSGAVQGLLRTQWGVWEATGSSRRIGGGNTLSKGL